ncbi:MAG: hypothetical protein ACRC6T_17740 [Sarcina sp.]
MKEVLVEINDFIRVSNQQLKLDKWSKPKYTEVDVDEWLEEQTNIKESGYDIFDNSTPQILVKIYEGASNRQIEKVRSNVVRTYSTKSNLNETRVLLNEVNSILLCKRLRGYFTKDKN